MKICLLNDSFPPVIDGVVNVVMNYANYLIKDHAAQVIVGTPEYPGADYTAYPYEVVAYPSLNTTAVASGYRTGYPFDAKSISSLAEFHPDIIHTHCPATATIVARLLREETHSPIIFTYHTKYDIDIMRNVKLKAIADESIKAMVSNIEACDDIWVVSRGAGESLKALGFQGDYRVMNNGVDFSRGRVEDSLVEEVTKDYDLPKGIPVFLFVGRMMTYKGLPLILDALKLLYEAGQDFRMVFVGKGPDRQLLEVQAEKLGISAKCIFAGPEYDRNRLRAWNTRADLFLFPSTFDTNGLVVREAAACALPSVLIKGSCAAEGITDGRNGYVIEESAVAMAELLKSASKNLDTVHTVGVNAMNEIYLSWEDCVSEAYQRYEEILEAKARGTLPVKKLQPTDYLVSVTAHRLSEHEKLRRLGRELFNDFKETAVGMMENIQDSDEDTTHILDKIAEQFQEFWRM